MLNPSIDPYEELLILKHNTNQLIKGHNHLDEAMTVLVKQHNDLIKINKELKSELALLKGEIYLLKINQNK